MGCCFRLLWPQWHLAWESTSLMSGLSSITPSANLLRTTTRRVAVQVNNFPSIQLRVLLFVVPVRFTIKIFYVCISRARQQSSWLHCLLWLLWYLQDQHHGCDGECWSGKAEADGWLLPDCRQVAHTHTHTRKHTHMQCHDPVSFE